MNKSLVKMLSRLIIVISCLMTLVQFQVFAQDDPYEQYRIYRSGLNLINISWANDSTRFVFQEEGSTNGFHTEGRNSWQDYSIATQQITTSEIWPLQAEVTATQWETFEIYPPATLARSFVFASPDGRYIVYSGIRLGIERPMLLPLGIADLKTSQYSILDEWLVANSAIINRPTIEEFFVRWSPDNRSFTISTERPASGTEIYFVDISSGVSNLQIQSLREGIIINSIELDTWRVLDIAGSHVLLYGKFAQNYAMVAWDTTSANGYEIPIVGAVAGAKFYGEELGEVRFVDESGLKQYCRSTSVLNNLNPTITSTWASSGAYFSPNGQYLAIYDGGRGLPSEVYIVPVNDLFSASPTT